jgi:hypothetical protein
MVKAFNAIALGVWYEKLQRIKTIN